MSLLGYGAFRSVAVDDGHVLDAPASIDRVDGELCLDLEALREDREGLNESARERAIARHDVLESVPIDPANHDAHKVVANAVERPPVLLRVGPVREAVADGHVRLGTEYRRHEVARRPCGIRVVTIDHQIAVSLDVAEHLPDDVALALTGLATYHGAMLACDVGGSVGRVVVIDVDRRAGKLPTEVLDHLGYGERLVVTGDENGNAAELPQRRPIIQWALLTREVHKS